MSLKDFFLEEISKTRRQMRERALAREIYTKWWLKGKIKYPEMMTNLRKQSEAEGLSVDNIFREASKLWNPTQSI